MERLRAELPEARVIVMDLVPVHVAVRRNYATRKEATGHLRNIMDKLALHTRLEIADFLRDAESDGDPG